MTSSKPVNSRSEIKRPGQVNARLYALMKFALLHSALLVALVTPISAQEKDDGKVTIDIPAAVQATIQKEKADGKVLAFRRVNENDGTTFVIELLLDAQNYTLSLDAAGRVMRKELSEERTEEKVIGIDDLPAAVKKVFLREAGGAVIKAIEAKQERKSFSAEVVIGTRKYAIEVDGAGKLIRKFHVSGADE